jgi:ABC-2 type transport system permease protein
MNVVWTTVKKELASYFFSPVAYVIAVLFYLFRGLEVQALARQMTDFALDADLFSSAYIVQQGTSFFMIVLVPPVLTMRCFAEERRTGSIEMLLTAPVTDAAIVMGKWLAALVFFGMLWLPTALFLWILTLPPFLGTPLALGPAFASYYGLSLLGAMLMAVGCFTSSLTDNQLLASLSAMLFNTALLAGPGILRTQFKDAALESHSVRTLFEQLDVRAHLTEWFSRGLIDTSQTVFYVAGTAFFLFLTVKSLESRQWR